jgi:hypothetical protein
MKPVSKVECRLGAFIEIAVHRGAMCHECPGRSHDHRIETEKGPALRERGLKVGTRESPHASQ